MHSQPLGSKGIETDKEQRTKNKEQRTEGKGQRAKSDSGFMVDIFLIKSACKGSSKAPTINNRKKSILPSILKNKRVIILLTA